MNEMVNEKSLEKCAHEMRKDILYMSWKAGKSGSHLGGSLSMVEILAVLYKSVMNISAKDSVDENRDRFILSKGHGAPALYAIMHQCGLIEDEELDTFKGKGSFLTGHPSMNVARGVEFSSGSLGQGLSLGVGTCLALRHKHNSEVKTYVLLGDGECNEGSVWEAAESAAHFGLNNLVAIVDSNQLQYDGPTTTIMNMEDMAAKWRSFGWEAIEVDGHNVEELFNAFQHKSDKPMVVIAHTVKGKGVSFMEGNPLWHHSILSEKQYNQAIEELEAVRI